VVEDIKLLRILVSNPSSLPAEVVVPLSKSILWRIGCGVDAYCLGEEQQESQACDVDHDALDITWECVASMTDHKLKGSQLQQLYGFMKQKGYTEGPPLLAEDLSTGGSYTC
jgi:hypothetical protein